MAPSLLETIHTACWSTCTTQTTGWWHTRMKLSLSSLLFVFLADKLNQACATPSSLRCCTWSLATCTVEQFPVKRKDQECSVIVKKDHGGKKIPNCWHGTGWSYHCGCAGQPSWTWHQHGTHNVPLASLQPLQCLARNASATQWYQQIFSQDQC